MCAHGLGFMTTPLSMLSRGDVDIGAIIYRHVSDGKGEIMGLTNMKYQIDLKDIHATGKFISIPNLKDGLNDNFVRRLHKHARNDETQKVQYLYGTNFAKVEHKVLFYQCVSTVIKEHF